MTSKARNIADLGSNDVIETSATGVDVTGTVSADGLTVDGTATIQEATGTTLTVKNTGDDVSTIVLGNTGSHDTLLTQENGVFTIEDGGVGPRFSIADNGDVSFYEDTGTTAKMVWDASAESLNLGGTATTNTAGFSQNLALKDLYPSITLEDTGTGTGKWTLGVTEGGIGFWDSITTQYRMRIDSSGNVGVGTTSPTGKFHIYGSDPAFRIQDSNGGNIQLGQWDSVTNRIEASGGNRDLFMVNYGTGAIRFGTNGANERARIDSSGNLLVGQTSGTGKLSVEGNIYSTRALYRLRTTSPTVGVGASGSVSFNIGTLKGYNRGVFEVSIFGYKNGGIEQAGAVMHLYMMQNPDDIEQPVVISESRITVGTATLSSGILTINFTNNGSFSMGGIKASLRQICEG